MTEGPLNESEMAWLEETLMSYGHDDASVIDVSELDGTLYRSAFRSCCR